MWGSKGYTSIDIEESDEKSYHSNTKWLHTNPIISCCIMFVLIVPTILLGGWVFYPATIDIIEKEGHAILNVKLASSNRFLTSDQHGNIFTTPFPWLNGSRFKLQQLQSTDKTGSIKYQLVSMVTGEAVTLNSHTNQLQARPQHYGYKTMYLSSDLKKYDLSPVETVSFISNLKMTEIDNTGNTKGVGSYGKSVLGSIVNIRTDNSYSNSISSTFLIEPMRSIKGVNIGSWFIPERWMYPEFYEGVEPFFSQICGLVSHLGFEVSEARMQQHLDTWFTIDDFDRLIESGIQSIRLPLGFWNLIPDCPYDVFVPKDVNLSLKYLDWAMNEAEKRGISVLLDLHGAPGSQNGFDHSGCGYDSALGQGWNTAVNRNLTLKAIEVMASRYGNRSNLIGIEILNEPALDLEKHHHEDLLHFYQSAYNIIRSYSASALVVVNMLWDDYYDSWIHDLLEPEYYNIIYDWHKYEFDALTTEAGHMKKVDYFHNQIKNHSQHHPLMIGEWSGTLGMNSKQPVDQAFITTQINAYNDAYGWYYWNFKVIQEGFLVWSLEDLIDQGYNMGFHDSPPSVFD